MNLHTLGDARRREPLASTSLVLTTFEELVRREAREFAEHAGRDLARVRLTPRHFKGEVGLASARPTCSRVPSDRCARARRRHRRPRLRAATCLRSSAGRRPDDHDLCCQIRRARRAPDRVRPGDAGQAALTPATASARVEWRQAALGRRLGRTFRQVTQVLCRIGPARLPFARPPPSGGPEFTARGCPTCRRNRSRAPRRRGRLLD